MPTAIGPRKVNGWLTMFWIAMIPASIALGLLSSAVYVSALSLWAMVYGHWSARQAARERPIANPSQTRHRTVTAAVIHPQRSTRPDDADTESALTTNAAPWP